VFLSVWFFFCILAFFVVGLLAVDPDGAVRPLWITPVVAGAVYVIALAVRAPFPFTIPRGGWWVTVGSVAVVGGGSYLLRSGGPEGRLWFLVLLALMCGYLSGVGIARARVLPDTQQASPPRFVWQMRKPQPSWRRAKDDPAEPPYRGY
jgi:hypothetical protein